MRREGHRVSTLALAGSTRRSADPAVDDHLGEQLLRDEHYREEHAIVARRIERTLRAHSLWTAAAPEPTLVRIANIQHLATPIRAQLAAPIDVLELAGLMHPTPAVGGEPWPLAEPLIPALEGLDRGWYAGPVGWTDATGDGELCVALRCALLRGNLARCYAGNGIVRDSDPQTELAETELKLAALLPLLARCEHVARKLPIPTPIASTIRPPTVTTSSDERIETSRKRLRIQAITNSSTATTAPATISALWTSGIRNGSVWNSPPSAVMPPVIDPRTTAEPRPVCSPVSDSASDQPMLTPAPSAVEKPTSRAVCESEDSAAAKIGAIDETVPSIKPTSAGWTTRRTKSRSSLKPERWMKRATSVPSTGAVASASIGLL